MVRLKTYEVYAAGIGFIGYVSALTERGAKIIARRMWPHVSAFSVTSV